MKQNKPRVFIGSSREAIEYVNAVQESLTYVAEVTPWTAAFNPLKYTMEDLEKQLDQNDFAVFICSPDDIINIRGTTFLTTRDNTLFEMGLFWGKLRRGRVFYLIPNTPPKEVNDMKIEEYHLLSDLLGLNPLHYDVARSIRNIPASVNVACGKMKEIITKLGPYEDTNLLLEQAKIRQKERDAVALFTLKLTKELMFDNTRIYDYLTDALRSVYAIHPGFSIDGVGVWQKEGSDGLRHAAGKVGAVDFYPFGVNDCKEEDAPDRVLVIDCFNKGEEIIFLTKDHLFKTYLICYPIDKELVLTITVSGSKFLSDEELLYFIVANEELIKTINYLLGGALE